MVSDSLKDEKIIAMALLKPGWESDYYGNPEIFSVAGMGRIVSSEELENGRSNIVLYGLKRIKILNEIGGKPYRLANIEILESENPETGQHKEKLVYLISTWNDMLGEKLKKHRIKVNTALPLGILTDVLSSVLMTNIFDRQKMLEELSTARRAERLIDFIETRLRIFSVTSRMKKEIRATRKLN